MSKANQFSLPNFFGLIAYLFVMDGGRLDAATVRGAARLANEPVPRPPNPPAPDFIVEELEFKEYAPLLLRNAPESEEVLTLT